eukprot:5717478-Alexandrium_andersonii.AAC.1
MEATGDESVACRRNSSEEATRAFCRWAECTIPAGSSWADAAEAEQGGWCEGQRTQGVAPA